MDGEHDVDFEFERLVRQVEQGVQQNKLLYYKPYDWQKEFHYAGASNQERMLMAANRVGKSLCAGAEMSMHLTGTYPDWWEGKKFNGGILAWCGSPTNETSRDIVQKELLGGLGEQLGTGWIPKSRIVGSPTTRQAGVKNVVDMFRVRHESGEVSTCILKTYEQGWQKWQGTAPHVVWLDEEPDNYMIYSESQTRVLTASGIVMVTFTPLHGVTELVEHFQSNEGDGIYLKGATWDDVEHLDKTERERLASSYRAHERDARTKGFPMLGEGAIFPIPDEDISVDPFTIPAHWHRIKGCDFGFDHPAAGAEIAWDRDQDIIYVVDCYKKAGQYPEYHAAWFNKSNKNIPVAWPHDGLNTEKAGGGKIKDAYRAKNVNMLSKSARYPKSPGEKEEKGGSQPQWPVIDEVRDRMMGGRFKVFSNLSQWFEEKRSFHVKATHDGNMKIVNRRDDILKATFYAVMMKRYAVPIITHQRKASHTQPIATSAL